MTHTVTPGTHERVREHLDTIETEYNVTVVLAVAHGSHAWGLANDDSDYDVKAVYVPDSLRQYAHLSDHRQAINRDFDDIEIEGWDIQKFAELLKESNEQAIDVLRSPIAYRERLSRDDLREYITENYQPIQLYHTYRAISKNNYRKYLSDHLTSNRDNTYPIRERRDDGYLVYNEHAGDELFVPNRVVDTPDDVTETIDLDFDAVDISDTNHSVCPNCQEHPDVLPTQFQTTQTKRTVKRNLAVLNASMYARYLKRTGETSGHDLPDVDFTDFLDNQAPDVFDDDIIDLAWELVELKLNGRNDEIGDRVGRDFAHPPVDIDHTQHLADGPDVETLNEHIDMLIDAAHTA